MMQPMRVQVHADVVDTELEGEETVLLHLYSKTYFSLNATGTCIWQGLKRGFSLDAISERLQTKFDVDAERARASIAMIVGELEHHGLVVAVPDTAAPPVDHPGES